MSIVKRPAVVPLALHAAAAILAPASAGQDGITIRANVNLVQLDVAVADKDGRPVAGLGKENFRLLDGGRVRPLARLEEGNANLSLVLVVDFSRSMRMRKSGVIDAVRRLRNRLSAGDEAAIIIFNERVRVLQQLTRDPTTDWAAVLERSTPDGKTAAFDALGHAARLLENAMHGRRVCILLSDGEDNASELTKNAAFELLRAQNVTVYAVGLFRQGEPETDAGFLRALAAESGGQAILEDHPDKLDRVLEAILRDLRSHYVVAFFAADARNPGGELRRVELTARDDTGSKLSVRTRKHYRVGPRQEAIQNGVR